MARLYYGDTFPIGTTTMLAMRMLQAEPAPITFEATDDTAPVIAPVADITALQMPPVGFVKLATTEAGARKRTKRRTTFRHGENH
jgi:hypothetical protein